MYRKLALGAAAVVIGVVAVAAWAGTTSSPPQHFVARDLAPILRPAPTVPEGTRYDAPELTTVDTLEFTEDPQYAGRAPSGGYTALFNGDNLTSATAGALVFADAAAARRALEPIRAATTAETPEFGRLDPLPFGGWGAVADFGGARAIVYGWSRGNAVFVAALTGAIDTEDAAAYAHEIDARASTRGR